MQPRHDSAYGHVHCGGDFSAAETFHVGEIDRYPRFFAQLLERLLDAWIRQSVQHLELSGFDPGAATFLYPGQPPVLDLPSHRLRSSRCLFR
jgi:hypothetical protein